MSDDTSDDKPRRRKRRAVATIGEKGADAGPRAGREAELEAEIARLKRELDKAHKAIRSLRG